MKTSPLTISLLLLAASIAFAPAAAAQAAPQTPAIDQAAVNAEVAGDYQFDMDGQTMVVHFWVDNGKLYGVPEGEDMVAEVVPVAGTPFRYTADPGNGALYELEFVRNEDGKIGSCVMGVSGMTISGKKIK